MTMNSLQANNVRQLRTMGYRFNVIEPQGKNFVLRQESILLTGKIVIRHVATLPNNGHVEMADVEQPNSIQRR